MSKGNIEWQDAWASIKELYNKVIQQGITPPKPKEYYTDRHVKIVLKDRYEQLKKLLDEVKPSSSSEEMQVVKVDYKNIENEIIELGENTKLLPSEKHKIAENLLDTYIKNHHLNFRTKKEISQFKSEIKEKYWNFLELNKRGKPINVYNEASTSVGNLVHYQPTTDTINELLNTGRTEEASEIAKKAIEQALVSFVKGEISSDEFNKVKYNAQQAIKGETQKAEKIGNVFSYDFSTPKTKTIKL